MTDKKRNIIYLLEYGIILMFYFSVLRGGVIVIGGYEDTETEENHGNHAVAVDDRNPVHGYVNAYTAVKIQVILTDGDADFWFKPIRTHLGFAIEAALPVNDFANDMTADLDHMSGPYGEVPIQYAETDYDEDLDGIEDDETVTWTISRGQIRQDNMCDTLAVQYVDFQVEFNDNFYDVNWDTGGGITKPSLKFDDTVPWPRIHYWEINPGYKLIMSHSPPSN